LTSGGSVIGGLSLSWLDPDLCCAWLLFNIEPLKNNHRDDQQMNQITPPSDKFDFRLPPARRPAPRFFTRAVNV
jgi:hypothetical protein